jgi:hypothetical protein
VLRDVPLCLTYKLLLIYFTQVRKGFKQASSTCTFYTLLHIHTHFYMHFYTSCYSTHSTVCSKNRNCMIKWDFFFHDTFLSFFIFYKNFTRSPNCYHLNVIVINYYLKSDKP